VCGPVRVVNTMDPIATLREEAAAKIAAAVSLADLEAVNIQYLGRKGGSIGELMRLIPTLSPEEKPTFGQRVNALKNEVSDLLENRRAALQAEEITRKLREEAVDVTRPGRVPAIGRRHPLTQTFEQVSDILVGLGFRQVDGPEVEDYEYNFAALNFQEEHPALDEQASFYVTENLLLRTQTTALQGRCRR
jgi:phenylalanyl-tRNA synthetase alpha chain